MLNQVFSFLATGISAVFGWFTDITDAIPGIIGAFLAFFTMFVIYRTLIKPLIGSSGISHHENRPDEVKPNDSVYTLGSEGHYLNGKPR